MTKTEIISIMVTFIGLAVIGSFFTILMNYYAKAQMEEIKRGNWDEELTGEEKYNRTAKARKHKINNKIIKNLLFYLALIIIVPTFVFSLISKVRDNVTTIYDKSIMVVASGSMSEKNDENNYLFENQLNNQFQTYDIIILEKVKSSEDLKLYDVIAYVNDEDITVIHRIIDIENGKYETRGDANDATDKYHPTYSDVIGRYTGKRIAGVGIFIVFLQSYFGIITVLSLLYCLIMFDKVNANVEDAKNKRISVLESIINFDSDDEIVFESKKIIVYCGNTYRIGDSGRIAKIRKENNEVIIEKVIYDPLTVTSE